MYKDRSRSSSSQVHVYDMEKALRHQCVLGSNYPWLKIAQKPYVLGLLGPKNPKRTVLGALRLGLGSMGTEVYLVRALQ